MKEKNIFLHQQDQSDCGVACLAMGIRYFGGEQSLERIREWSGTTKSGTTMLGLFQAAQKTGLKVGAYSAKQENLKELKTPAILHVVMDETIAALCTSSCL